MLSRTIDDGGGRVHWFSQQIATTTTTSTSTIGEAKSSFSERNGFLPGHALVS
jgi:hypothetical protein